MGSWIEKFKLALIYGSFLVPVMDFIEQYVFNDWEFVVSMMTLVALDTVLGFYRNWQAGTFSSEGIGKLFQKVLLYACLLVVTHVLRHYKIHGQEVHIFTWIDYFIYSAIMVKEAVSVLEHIAALNKNLIPEWVIDRLKEYRDKGKIEDK